MEEVQAYHEWLDYISKPRKTLGCFFIFGDSLQPYFWGTPYSVRVPLEDAWASICREWLNKVYKQDLTALYPYVVKGVVEEEKVLLGNDCPFYTNEILFNFKMESLYYEIDPSLSVSLDIPQEIASLLMRIQRECPYFEKLSSRVQFHRKDYGPKGERDLALTQIVEKAQAMAKAKRFGSLPSLEK